MGFIAGIWMVVLGVLGAANLIIARKPEAKELIGKMAPYQGWIGAVSALWGIWEILWCILHLGYLTLVPLGWIIMLVTGVLQLTLGLLLGVGVLKTFIKQPQAVAKMDQTITKLAPYQGTLGIISIAVGLLGIIIGIIW